MAEGGPTRCFGRPRPPTSSVLTRTYDRLMSKRRRYRLMDLFAGCGGMTRGFVDTGRYEPVFAVEMDDAAATYAANFGTDHVVADKIENVEMFPEADVVIGGPPCQGFSLLNRNGSASSGARSGASTSAPSARARPRRS